jgi:hypothetical protein
MAVIMADTQWIALRTVLAIDADGREFPLTFGVGVPFESEPGMWACPVRLDIARDVPFPIYGVDSWQAMQLAVQLIAHLLHDFTAVKGGKLLWPDEREPISVAELIPQIPMVASP